MKLINSINVLNATGQAANQHQWKAMQSAHSAKENSLLVVSIRLPY
jgi:hypothetical protein